MIDERKNATAVSMDKRAFWVQGLCKVVHPIFSHLRDGNLKKSLPVFHADRQLFAPLEAFARCALGTTPWLAVSGVGTEEEKMIGAYREMFQIGLRNATHPDSLDRMLFDGSKGRQPLVDAAFLCESLVRTPALVQGILDKESLVKALEETRKIPPANNNWLLFSAMVETGLCLLGADYDEGIIDQRIRTILSWYQGDGVYGDGPFFHADYYNSFVIHPMLVDVVCFFPKRYSDVKEVILERAHRFSSILERMISPDGYFPFLGRSITYRTGVFHLLAQACLQGFLDGSVAPAQVRCALTQVMKNCLLQEQNFKDGWLQPGICGRKEALAESYINIGSLYLCSTIFLPLGLTPDAEFWSASDSAWTARRICAGENLAADKALADRMDGNSIRTQIEGIKNLLETARVDVKNIGTAENDVRIEVLNDAKCQMNKPAWFSKDRRGYGSVITSSFQHIKWKVTCVQDGNLLIRLMGIDWRDASGTRVPLWVDYTYFAVDGKAIFAKTIPACHDKHYDFYQEVRDGDVLEVEICWKPHVYSGDGMLRILYSKFSVDAKNGMNPQPRPDIPSNVVPELHWAQVYHDTIANSEWLLDKSVSPGGVRGWAVGYNFLYALYRILDEMRPQHILELGLGQSTKLTGQYADYFDAVHTVVEHDQEWVDFFCHGWKKLSQQTQICISPLVEREFDGQKYFAYQEFDKIMESQNTTYELVLVDGPFGGRSERSRRDIIAYLPELLSKEFVIMVDDCGRKGEINLLREIEDILGRNKIEYASGLYRSGGNCHVGVLVCKKWKFFTTM